MKQEAAKVEAREKAWDAYASEPVEFTISQTFNRGFDAGFDAGAASRPTDEGLREAIAVLDAFQDSTDERFQVVTRNYEIMNAICTLIVAVETGAKSECTWTGEFEGGVCSTQCGTDFMFNEDGWKENGFVFCPFCGGKITPPETKPCTKRSGGR